MDRFTTAAPMPRSRAFSNGQPRAREHGVVTIVMNPDVRRDGAEKTDEELALQARNLDRLGAALQGMGLSLAVHAHDKEMRSGAREWYYNLRHTDGAKVGICLDVHWLYRGGQDPLPMLRAAGGARSATCISGIRGTACGRKI